MRRGVLSVAAPVGHPARRKYFSPPVMASPFRYVETSVDSYIGHVTIALHMHDLRVFQKLHTYDLSYLPLFSLTPKDPSVPPLFHFLSLSAHLRLSIHIGSLALIPQ